MNPTAGNCAARIGPNVSILYRIFLRRLALQMLGAALPKKLLEVAPGNAAGYCEPIELVSRHDQSLAEAGSRWTAYLFQRNGSNLSTRD